MTSHMATARLRQSGRLQQQRDEHIDANSLFASKGQLAPPSSASSFLSAWQQHSAASSSPSTSAVADERLDSDDEQSDHVVLELPDSTREKSTELADAVLLLRPPRRSNDPMFRAIPLRTQSTASSSAQPQPQSSHSTLTSYASAPGKRLLDEQFISSSQPLPGERWSDQDDSPVQSPASSKQKTQHLTPPRSNHTGASHHASSHSPATTRLQPTSIDISALQAATATATASYPTASASASTAPNAALSKPVIEASAESGLPSVLTSLQLLSPHVYQLSQYHMLRGLCLMRDGDLQGASEQFTLADELFQPALDLLPASAFAAQKADMLTLKAKVTAEAALSLQAAGDEKESEAAQHEREEKTRLGVEKARRLYAAAINADESRRGELWNDLCLFLLRVGELQTAGQLLELLVGACGDCLDLFVNLGALHAVYGDADVAGDYFQHVLTRSPQHVIALVSYAASLSTRQQHQAAVRILRLAHHLHPRSVLVLNNLAAEYAVLGDHLAAAGWLQKADEVGYDSERVATASLKFNTANTMLALACEQADDEVRAKLLDGAESLLSTELARETKGSESQMGVLLHVCRGNVNTERLRLAQQAGDVAGVADMFAAAEADYKVALALQPDNSDVWVAMCRLYEEHREARKAKAIYTRLLDTLSSTSATLPASAVPLLNNLALLLMDETQHKEAMELLLLAKRTMEPLVEAATTQPSSPASPASPPRSASIASPATAASTVGVTTFSSASTQLASVLVNLSHCQQLLGWLDAALKSLQHARRLRPAHLSTLAGLSSVYSQLGAWKEAEGAMDEAAGLAGESGKGADAELVKRNKRALGLLRTRSAASAESVY